MMLKELIIALTVYNLISKLIAKSVDKVGFSPQEDIFPKCNPFGRAVLLDKRGRVFFKWSQGRSGYADVSLISHRKGKRRQFPRKTKRGKYQKY